MKKIIDHHASGAIRGLLVASALLWLAGCGNGEDAPSRAANAENREPSATLRWDGREMEFTGRFCFLTESGGSEGGVDVSDWTSSDGAELSLDWAGDSQDYAMLSIEFADGREFRAVASEPGQPPLDVTISGSTATVRANLRESMVAEAETLPATVEVRCP